MRTLPLKNKLVPITPTDQEKSREAIEKLLGYQIDGSTEVIKRKTLLYIGEYRAFRECNISAVIGQAGHGKSTLLDFICAEMLNNQNEFFKSEFGPDDTILVIDTEQDDEDVQESWHRINKLSGGNGDRVKKFSLVDLTRKERLDAVEMLIDECKPTLVIIDGLTDLMKDPNSLDEAGEIIEDISKLSKRTNTHIMNVIHQNEGGGSSWSGKARGHVGSEAHRKCETMMSIQYDKGTQEFTVTPIKFRKGRWDEWAFVYDREKGIPVFVGEPQKTLAAQKKDLREKAKSDEQIMATITKAIFGRSEIRGHLAAEGAVGKGVMRTAMQSEFLIETGTKLGDKAARHMVDSYVREGFFDINMDEKYTESTNGEVELPF